MKALAVRQPWAGLIVKGIKDVECRGWSTKYRGPLLIQSAAAVDREALEAGIGRPPFPTGQIIGMVTLVDVVTEHESKWAEPEYSRYFVLEGAIEFSRTIPWKGQLGLYDVPDDVVAPLM